MKRRRGLGHKEKKYDPDIAGQCSLNFIRGIDPEQVYFVWLTEGRYQAGVICSYGYTGCVFPSRALERLQRTPV